MEDMEDKLTFEIFKVIADMNKESSVDNFICDLVRNNPLVIANVLVNKKNVSELIVALKRNREQHQSEKHTS